MNKWPLVNRNKVEDSKVSIPVRMIVEKEDLPEPLRGLAQSVNFWNTYVLLDTSHPSLASDPLGISSFVQSNTKEIKRSKYPYPFGYSSNLRCHTGP